MTIPNAPGEAPDMDPQNSRRAPDRPPVPDAHLGEHPAEDLGDRLGGGLGDPLGDGLDEAVDEATLRTLMQNAVSGIHGSPDALDHLRRAIPLRRQRRRQALVGAAAVLLLAGMAVPALLRATGTGQGVDASAASVTGSRTGMPGSDGQTTAWGESGFQAGGQASPGPGAGPTPQLPIPSGTYVPSNQPASSSATVLPAPECSSSQLGQGASKADAPDSGGRVYGWFRVANVSSTACTVPSTGAVQAVAQGGADPSRIQIVDHTAGDAAAGLPTAPVSGPVVLKPGQNYEVAFAWVPASNGPGGCPATPTTPPTTPTPTDTPTDTTGPVGGTSVGSSGAPSTAGSGNAPSTQLREDTPTSPAPGSVALNHTPAAGAPVIDGPVIEDACAGTVYTTTPIPEPAATPTP
jgi:hypothetical protein